MSDLCPKKSKCLSFHVRLKRKEYLTWFPSQIITSWGICLLESSASQRIQWNRSRNWGLNTKPTLAKCTFWNVWHVIKVQTWKSGIGPAGCHSKVGTQAEQSRGGMNRGSISTPTNTNLICMEVFHIVYLAKYIKLYKVTTLSQQSCWSCSSSYQNTSKENIFLFLWSIIKLYRTGIAFFL